MSQWSHEFPLDESLCYLNHAAVAPWPMRATRAVEHFAQENSRLGATHYPSWVKTETRLRKLLAELINAPSVQDIALLKNTSEALSVVAYGLSWQPGDNVVITDQEFPSNRIVWESLQDQGVEVRAVALTGENPEADLQAACDERTRIMSISSVQYATGFKLALVTLGEFCQQQDILFCVDAIQSLGALEFDVQEIQADYVMADGHKWLLGPEGLAVFYSSPKGRDQLKVLQYGWHMVEHMGDYTRDDWSIAKGARRFECGSPNMLGTHALVASVELLLEVEMHRVEAQLLHNVDYLQRALSALPGVKLISETREERHGGIVTFDVPGKDTEAMYAKLNEQGVICAHRGGGIRLSPHFYTPQSILDKALSYIEGLL
ncbi:aminotransferase class V-fold PLP-dependent enzyme [Zooshikella harenae]|uniref:Aminotransferase class V-fold PLP-dependent enzyme n=1 Tax=Zooshikella harenae TaxID=2827238 RepID=A0ABS5ZGP3_9GAMM|nr:aminotransferase class V-fold PLP-dependent enzyme [Zooshikella harenae]MBU2713231.1 aminotransferase class V-fold PLP-dependent enzyme [Zooshikella harenae]